MNGPSIAIVLDAGTGTITNVTVLTSDAPERHRGLAVIQALREELEVFEARVAKRLQALRKCQ